MVSTSTRKVDSSSKKSYPKTASKRKIDYKNASKNALIAQYFSTWEEKKLISLHHFQLDYPIECLTTTKPFIHLDSTLKGRGVTLRFGLVFSQKKVWIDETFIGLDWFDFHCFSKKKPNQISRFSSNWIGSVDRFN